MPKKFVLTCKRLGVLPTRPVLVVSVRLQRMWLYEVRCDRPPAGAFGSLRLSREFRVSTSRFGAGQQAGSNRTPLGLHKVARKIGGGEPIGTVFRSREPVGLTWRGTADGAIVHRILWLEGLEPGKNRGGNVDSRARYIYIHGVADETALGKPASKGCVHLAAADLVPLFDRVPEGTLVWIE